MQFKKVYCQTEKSIHALSRTVGIIAIGILMAMMLLTVADVFLRKCFNRPIYGSVELIELMMVCAGFLGLGWCASKKMHICVDLLVNKFSPEVRGIIGFATYSFSLLACVIISWRTAVESIAVRELNSVSASFGIPLQPFYWITAFGFAVLCLEILILLIEATKGILGK